MRRKSRGSTGRRPSTFKQARRRAEPLNPPNRLHTSGRGEARRTTPSVLARPTRSRIHTSSRTLRSLESQRRIRDQLQPRHRKRRTPMSRPRQATQRGLPTGSMPLRRTNENASDQQTTRSVCTRTKDAKRAVILALGYGGKNGYTNYSNHRKC